MAMRASASILWAACLIVAGSGVLAGESLVLPPSDVAARVNAHEPTGIPAEGALDRLADTSARYAKAAVDDRRVSWDEKTVLHGIALGRVAGTPLSLDVLANVSDFKSREVETARRFALARDNVFAALTLGHPRSEGSAASFVSFERVFNSTGAYDQRVELPRETTLAGLTLLRNGIAFDAAYLVSYQDVARGTSATRGLPEVDPRFEQSTDLAAQVTAAALPLHAGAGQHGALGALDALANVSWRNSDSGTRAHDITLTEDDALAAVAAKHRGIPVDARQVWSVHDVGTVNRIDQSTFMLDPSTVRNALALGAMHG